MEMDKKLLAAFGVLLAVISAVILLVMGRTYVFEIPVGGYSEEISDYTVKLDQKSEGEVVRAAVTDLRNSRLYVTVESVSRGKTYLYVLERGEEIFMDSVYTHSFGILTANSFFGRTRGAAAVPFAVILFLAALFIYRFRKLRNGLRKNLYQYRNINNLGWVIFLGAMILSQIFYFVSYFSGGLDEAVQRLLYAASAISVLILPIAFIVSLLVSATNIRLMQREGKRVKTCLA